MDYENCFLVSVALCAGCVTVMHGYDGSMTAVGHYFKGIVQYFHYSHPATMITTFLLLQSKFWLSFTQCITFNVMIIIFLCSLALTPYMCIMSAIY